MFQNLIRKFLVRSLYPLLPGDWYKLKRYRGAKTRQRFLSFIASQREKNSAFYQEFRHLKITRQNILSGGAKLDSVLAVPNEDFAKNKPGEGLCFIMFFGRLESYEKRFRDIATQASRTGASVFAFNHKGMFCSEGETNSIESMVEDGIAAVDFLLEKGIDYDDIILQGNSLGAAVQEMVSEHYRAIKGRPFRQINSNSFKTLGSVMADILKIPVGEKIFDRVINYLGWEFKPGPDFYKTGPYRFHLRRINDRTISRKSEYHAVVDFQKDNDACPLEYKETHRWLYEHSQIVYRGESKKNPHMLSLYMFEAKDQESGKYMSVYDVINRYLEAIKKLR
jgi:hypothetical protein